MSDQKLDTQIRREQIAEAALDLVAGGGVRRLSVAAVARRVGLVPSGIYRHYKSKDAMLAAVLDLLQRRIQANVHAACQETDDPLGQLRGILVRHVRAIRENRAIPRIIFSDDVHAGDRVRKNRILQIMMGYLGEIGRIVAQARQQGLIRQDVDPEVAAMLFFGMIVPAGIRWHLTDGGFDITRHAERSWELFRAAIAHAEVNADSHPRPP